MKCLIIDDDLMMRMSLERLCSKIPGLTVMKSVDNGKDALCVLQNEDIDLILLDMNLPHVSGVEIIQQLTPKINIICTSASDFPDLPVSHHNILAKFIKPIRPQELQRAIQRAFQELY